MGPETAYSSTTQPSLGPALGPKVPGADPRGGVAPTPPDRTLCDLLYVEGLAVAGVGDAAILPEARSRFAEWLARGYAGSMWFLHKHLDAKYDPRREVAGARSVAIVAANSYQPVPPRPNGGVFGRVARYAWGRDYHAILGTSLRRVRRHLEGLFPTDRFRSFVDVGPLDERAYGEMVGIGTIGRNGLLYTPYGPWGLLGHIVSTLDSGALRSVFPPITPIPESTLRCPPGCFVCAGRCPTGAIGPGGVIEARRCISYLTIENRGSIPRDFRRLVGDHLFGCDVCAESCPRAGDIAATSVSDFLTLRAGPWIDLAGLLAMSTDEEFRTRFAGTPLMRCGRLGIQRNACVVAGNVLAGTVAGVEAEGVADRVGAPGGRRGDAGATDVTERLLAQLQRHRSGENAMVAEHADWALVQLDE